MIERDSERLSRWFDAHSARLVLYARNWLDAGSAEDVVQEVFLRLLGASHSLVDEKAWLFTAVRNAAISAKRSLARRGKREEKAMQGRPDWFESRAEDLIDAAAAQEALSRIPSEQREVILLRLWGGLTLATNRCFGSVGSTAIILSAPDFRLVSGVGPMTLP